jgi:hypothetical protein
MEPDPPQPLNPRVQALMWNLPIDAATLEVTHELASAGIGSVVLKGPALTDWYPEDSSRTYGDCDLWVPPSARREVETTLQGLGYRPVKPWDMPEWWTEHATEWVRAADGVNIDLHGYLQGVGADPHTTWELIWPRCVEFTFAGGVARRLPDEARAMYVTLHATHHGAGRDASLQHLSAALSSVSDSTWRSAAALASELGALESFATGLRLVPGGVELAARIGVPDVRAVRTSLLASTPPPVALGFDQLAQTRGARRVEVLTRKVIPPAGFVRHWWPPAARSRRMLIVGYLYRPVWLLRHAPAGYRAWRAARREASNSV